MKTSSLPSRKLLVWETQSTRLFLLFNIIQQSSRYSSQSEAGWWCLKHRFFASPGRWSPGLRKVVPTSSMRSSNPRTHSFLGQERGKFILGPQWDSKIPRNSNLFFCWNIGISDSVGFQDSKLLFFWIMCRHTLFTTLKRFKKCLAGSLIEAERLDKYTSDSLELVGR